MTATGTAPLNITIDRSYDPDAERGLLGCLLTTADAAVLARVAATDFYDTTHAAIYTAMVELADAGTVIEPNIIASHLRATGKSVTAIGELRGMAMEAEPANITAYADRVLETSAQRRIINTVVPELCSSSPSSETIAAINDALAAIDLSTTSLDQIERPGAYIDELLTEWEKGTPPSRFTTGLTDLDEMMPMRDGSVYVLGARTGDGKSLVAATIARTNAVKHQRPVLYISVEMTRNELLARVVAAETRINLHDVAENKLTDEHWTRIAVKLDAVSNAPLYLVDTPAQMTLAAIQQAALRVQNLHDGEAPLIVIDYLQLLHATGNYENANQRVAALSWGIKLLAKKLNTPIVLLSQLNRGNQNRADKTPTMSDLRDSGSIEQDASGIMLLSHPTNGDPNSPRAGELDIIIAKHRHGPTGIITASWQPHYSRVVNMAAA